MLDIEDLHVNVGDKEVLHGINLHIGEGETHVLMGPNGSGKTTLLMALMGFSSYNVTKGKILFKGEDVTAMHADERSKRGIGMLFQRPPTISGLKLGKLLTAISRDKTLDIPNLATSVHMGGFLERDINKGFSGGEIKRSEVLQLDDPEPGVCDARRAGERGRSRKHLADRKRHRNPARKGEKDHDKGKKRARHHAYGVHPRLP